MKIQLVAKVFLITAVLLLCCQSGFVQAKNIYVDCTRPDGGDGSSWATAYTYLQDALAAAVSGDNIWVAPGTYKPDQGNGFTPGDRSAAFRLKGGVIIFGGGYGYYYGKTILSGDLNGDDGPNFSNYTDNSYNVVICDTITQHAGIGGFTITGGNAEGPYPYNRGGGMLIKSSIGADVGNCIFSGNMAQHAGGGLYSMNGSNPLVENCIFSGNKAQNAGGGMQDAGGSSALINCTFHGNVTVDNPGWGGGLRIYNSTTTMTNCIFWGNSAAKGNQIAVDNASTPSISYSDIQGGQSAIYKPDGDGSTITWGSGNIDADPLFEEFAQGNYHLRKGSPCVDTGTKTGAPEYDYEGSPRLSSVGGDDKPDMGADELIVREVGKTGYSYSTIQAAIDAAGTGDLVLVHNGNYVENIDFKGMAIRVRSENGAGKTTIDGNQSGSVVAFASNEVTESILEGFTITNGNSDSGGGIFCDFSSPTITNCTIAGNKAVNDSGGGGIRLQNSSSILTNCIITKNNAGYGGGIFCQQSSPSLINCTIAQNMATSNYSGGGICVMGPSSHPTVKNSILWGDTAGGAINEIFLDQNSSFSIAYSDVQGGWTGQGNINSDPLFVDATNGDYHLLSGSPCLDVGTAASAPVTDIAGTLRPQGAGFDMGAYESVLPEPFGKNAPNNNATNQPPSLTLSWNYSEGATTYEYCYDTSNDNACSGSWTPTDSITITSANLSGLATNTTYYWQVRAINGGNKTYADNGTWWNFTVKNSVSTTTTTVSGGVGGGGGGGSQTTTTTTAPITTTTITIPVTSTTTSSIPPECATDGECDDGVFCNGVETCSNGNCIAGQNPCSQGQVCREETDACWNQVSITATCMQKVIMRPLVREQKCPWLILFTSQEHHFMPGGSSTELTGAVAEAQGVTSDTRRKAFSFGNLIFIPVCVERGASTGQWYITIKTDVANATLEETIVTSFQVT